MNNMSDMANLSKINNVTNLGGNTEMHTMNNQNNQESQVNQQFGNNLAMQSFETIPNANVNACEIVAQVKSSGDVTGYQLSNGQTVDLQTAVQMAKNREIKGVGVATNQGTEYLRSLPDNDASNNLGNLPTVSN